jgi:mannose-6-phosphate isomerase-like protein (cupin superfamily)
MTEQRPEEGPGRPHIVNKPWGHEEWLALTRAYAYKRIYIRAGQRTSLQYHERKIETNYIISGEAEVWLQGPSGDIRKERMCAGDYFTVQPLQKHRVVALSDLVLQEVSSPEVNDVVRLEDDTHRPDGRIPGEHADTQRNPTF